MAVSPHGERLLVSDPIASGGRTLCACSLVDGSTGAVDPIEALRPSGRRSTPITGTMLSPDGSLLITVSGLGGKQVAVRDPDGSNETVLISEPASAGPSALGGAVRTWATNDTILIGSYRNDRGTLLVVDRDR